MVSLQSLVVQFGQSVLTGRSGSHSVFAGKTIGRLAGGHSEADGG